MNHCQFTEIIHMHAGEALYSQPVPPNTFGHDYQEHTYEPQNTNYHVPQSQLGPIGTYQNGHSNAASPVRYCGAFPPFFSLKCHGTKGAIELKPSITRKGQWHTVMLEGALAIPGSNRQFDWRNKLAVQITKSEICSVAAVLLGLRTSFEGNNHGPQKNKGMKITWQENRGKAGVFVNLMEGGKPAIAVPITGYDSVMLAHMVCSQYVLNFPGLSVASFIETLKLVNHMNV
ncbi:MULTISPECIES: hypothetical protein [Shewanella]|uniref:hypothetical protein n=1 Tax=Shewanella TaxID=22 RepID=UPI000F4317CF|nr:MULTISPECIES: hypothetical protein [Shewanella]AYV11553.1 hypothetical protein EEY24_00865 [Shewanella algae]